MEKLAVVAIGGGSPAINSEHLKCAVEMTGIEHSSHVLIIPTAITPKEQKYEDNFERRIGEVENLYKDQLKLPVAVLHGYNTMPSRSELKEKLDWADVAYITGGRTEHMMEVWEKYDIDKLLIARAIGGLVLSGTSAGSIAPFAWGHADPFPDSNAKMGEFVKIDGLGLVHAAVGPHHNKLQGGHDYRRQDFIDMFASDHKLKYGFGINNQAAVIIDDGLIRSSGLNDNTVTVISSNTGNNRVSTEIMSSSDTIPLKDL